MSIVLLGIVLLYVFYKIVDMWDGDVSENEGVDDFIAMRDATSIARGENPLDPDAQIKSITDSIDIFGE